VLFATIVLLCKTKAEFMKTEMLSTRIDHNTKLAFTHVCDEVGLSPSQAIKLFAKAVINYGGIPFELRSKTPNSKTLEAIQELESGNGKVASDVSQLFQELGVNKI
jgi:DNA-damage-inducible protein J